MFSVSPGMLFWAEVITLSTIAWWSFWILVAACQVVKGIAQEFTR